MLLFYVTTMESKQLTHKEKIELMSDELDRNRDYHHCTRHEQYKANPRAKVCGWCGDLISRKKEVSKLPSLLLGVGLGIMALASSALSMARNMEIPPHYVKITGMSKEQQLALLDRNENGIVDNEESEHLVVRNLSLYYTGDVKGGNENYDRR